MPGKHYDLDTDVTLSGNDDKVIASQKATKTYVDTEVDKKADPTIIRDTNSDISVKELVINRLTNDEYEVAVKEDDQLYLTPDTTDQDIADAVSAHNTSNSAHSTLFNAKQDKLATQTAYTSKGTASKVPQITTNTLGQVTNITEVDIAHQSIKTLKTDNTTGQTASSSETIAGSGTINLHKVSKTGSYNDLLNKPSINNNTITIQKNSTIVDSFTLNQSTDKSINISVPTTVAELSDSSNYVQTSSLEEAATVAKTGDYNDLINKPTIPQGTVTSVRVQATSPVISSQNTAQTGTLNTTISLANAYGDTKNPYGNKNVNYVLAGPTSGSAAAPTFRALTKADIPLASETAASGGTTTSLVTTGEKYTWNNKQDALTTQTAYTSKGSATKVPQITTNNLGQVTGITEVTISQPTVNNKTITIQKNSTTVDSFTLNQNTDKTINITVPTKTSDITNDSGFLTSHQDIKTLKTDNTTTQTASTNEAINGNGTINLHKVSKTGSYNDLLDKPTIPTTTNSVTSGSTAALTSGGAYTNLVRRKSTTAATGGANQGVYVDANGQVQTCNATTSTYSSTGTTAVNGTAVASALGSYIPKNLKGTLSETPGPTSPDIYGTGSGRPQKSLFMTPNIMNLGRNVLYYAHKGVKNGTPATVTCNYTDKVANIATEMLDGSTYGYYTAINPSTMFTDKPFIWELTCTNSYAATDVAQLLLTGHNVTANALHATKYKLEVAVYKSSTQSFTWATIVDYEGSSVTLTPRFFSLYSSELANGSSYIYPNGIRLTISASPDTVFCLSGIQFIDSRGNYSLADSMNALDRGTGGSVYGNITIPTANGSFVGNLTGTADKATKDGDNNTISSTYLKLAGGTLTGAVNTANNTLNKIGDDAYIGDVNIGGCIGIKGQNGATGIVFKPYSGSTDIKMTSNGSGTLTVTGTISSTFSGDLTGTASKATADADGNTISTTYLKTANLPTKLSDFTDDLGSSPTHTHSQYLTDHQTIKTLKTTNTTAQSTSASETITGSGTINLHKIAKTGTFSDLLSKPTSLSGYGITDAYTKTEVDGMISSVYKPAGSVAFASLPTLSDNVLGNVYNVTDAFTTTANFVEGAGKSYPAGTNVVVVNTGTTASPTYKFDVLAGFVDLSGYVPTSRKVNNKALSADITLIASDVGAVSTTDGVTAVVAGSTANKIDVTKNGSTSTITVNNVANATLATKISTQSGTANSNRHVFFAHASDLTQVVYNDKFKYNPSTDILTVGSITGLAAKATADASGNTITTTYATKAELPTVNNKTITIQKNSTTVDTFTLNQSTDKTINITMAKGDVGLGNVDNTSDSTKNSATATLDNKTIDGGTF